MIALLGDDGEHLALTSERVVSDPEEVISFEEAELAAPLQPRSIRDTLLFLQHVKNARGGAELDLWLKIKILSFSKKYI